MNTYCIIRMKRQGLCGFICWIVYVMLVVSVWEVMEAKAARLSYTEMVDALNEAFDIYLDLDIWGENKRSLLDSNITQENNAYCVNLPNFYIDLSYMHMHATYVHLQAFEAVSKITATAIRMVGDLRNPWIFGKLLVHLLLVIDVKELYINITNTLGISPIVARLVLTSEIRQRLAAKHPISLCVVNDQIGVCAILSIIYMHAPLKSLSISSINQSLGWPCSVNWTDDFSLVLSVDWLQKQDLENLLFGCGLLCCQSLTIQNYTPRGLQTTPQQVYQMVSRCKDEGLFWCRQIKELTMEYEFFIYMCASFEANVLIRSVTTLTLLVSSLDIKNLKNACLTKCQDLSARTVANIQLFGSYDLLWATNMQCFKLSFLQLLIPNPLSGLNNADQLAEPQQLLASFQKEFLCHHMEFINIDALAVTVCYADHQDALEVAIYKLFNQISESPKDTASMVTALLKHCTESAWSARQKPGKYLFNISILNYYTNVRSISNALSQINELLKQKPQR
ncbi:hypothetical protein NEHOM01_2500, partial [Nematocida homosporus]|uniref:uncharacterized protein n=1 Tax=Nematocida homosporus TaxID=1912981 RepID=UPI00221E6F48